MKFIFLEYKKEDKYVIDNFGPNDEDVAIFVNDPWNDYGYSTLYHLYIYYPSKYRWDSVGTVKILALDRNGTSSYSTDSILKQESRFGVLLDSLPTNYYSLGQSNEFYSKLKHLLGNKDTEFLNAIRDVTTSTDLYEDAAKYDGYRTSLTRENTAEYVINSKVITQYQFIDFALTSQTTSFEFRFSNSKYNDKSNVISRINVLIGKNSIGKTYLLSSLSELFYSNTKSSNFKFEPLKMESKKRFNEDYPTELLGFSKYISISANAFDDFCTARKDDFYISQLANLASSNYLNHKKMIEITEEYDSIKKEFELRNKVDLITNYSHETPNGIEIIDQSIIELIDMELKYKVRNKILDYNEKCKTYEKFATINKLALSINTKEVFERHFSKVLLTENSSYCYIGLRSYNQLDSTYLVLLKLLDSIFQIYMDETKIGTEELFRSDIYEKLLVELVFYKNKYKADEFKNELKEIISKFKHDTNKKNESALSRLTNDIIYDFDILFRTLSSGQSYIFFIITCLMKVLMEGSLIIIDEPELHLHPNAISNFVRNLHMLLNQFNAYAVLCTHNPIILQEIPRDKIIHLDKIQWGNNEEVASILNSKPLVIESYGNSIDNIVQEVFEVKPSESYFRESFNRLIKDHSPDDIFNMFNRELSRQAYFYLLELENKVKNNEQI